jgi:hypothetical protein
MSNLLYFFPYIQFADYVGDFGLSSHASKIKIKDS